MFNILITTLWVWWVYEVADHEVICWIKTEPNNYPTEAQLIDECPYNPLMGLYFGEIAMDLVIHTWDDTPPPPFCSPPAVPVGTGLLETPPTSDGLHTADELLWLSERLAWYGRDETPTEWQNKFNADILEAARSSGVPAVLLKKLIGVESQFWPLWTPSAGEIGMAQITDAGVDVVMRYDEGVYNHVCKSAIRRCHRGYSSLLLSEQKLIRDVFRATLHCNGCDVDQAIAHERANIVFYARILRAYGCRNSWDWSAALKDYNGGDKYLDLFGLGG